MPLPVMGGGIAFGRAPARQDMLAAEAKDSALLAAASASIAAGADL